MRHIHFLPAKDVVKMLISQVFISERLEEVDLTLMLPIHTTYTSLHMLWNKRSAIPVRGMQLPDLCFHYPI